MTIIISKRVTKHTFHISPPHNRTYHVQTILDNVDIHKKNREPNRRTKKWFHFISGLLIPITHGTWHKQLIRLQVVPLPDNNNNNNNNNKVDCTTTNFFCCAFLLFLYYSGTVFYFFVSFHSLGVTEEKEKHFALYGTIPMVFTNTPIGLPHLNGKIEANSI